MPVNLLLGTTYYISGKDTINAQWEKDPSTQDTSSITTRVPGLQTMPGSEQCPPGHIGESFGTRETYFFIKQAINGCLFYGTAETSGALIDLANLYVEKQKECVNSTDHICDTQLGSNPDDPIISVYIDKVIPLGISAMGLPWGGLLDYSGNWQPPYNYNSDGKGVNISWKDQQGTIIDDDHKVLLWSIIKTDVRWLTPVDKEGGDFAKTYEQPYGSDLIDNSRFHI